MLPGRQQLPVTKVESHLCDGERDEAQAHQDGTQDADEEGEVVPAADTLVEPLAVVVKHVDTFVTDRAVLRPGGGDVDLAQMAPPVLDDVVEPGLVELRDRLLGVEGQQGGVRGVDEEGGEVGDVVDSEDEDVEDQQGQLGGAVDGGDEGEEDVDGEGEEEDPGHDLLGMKGQLKAVDPPPFSEFLHCRVTCWLWHNSGYFWIPLELIIYM